MPTIEIPLKRGKFAIIDREDLEYVMRYDWWLRGGGKSNNWYARTYILSFKKEMAMHSYLMQCPPDMVVDHRNGDGLDNRRCNLRICTKDENARNRSKQSNHNNRFKSVSRRKNGRYVAYISHNGKKEWLGTFDTEIEAAEAYNKKAIEYHGEFANLNTIESIRRPVALGISWK